MNRELHDIDLAGRTSLQHVEQGDPSRPPLVLLHGWPDSRRSFERVLDSLPSTLHRFALTQPGFGDAGRPERG